MKLIATAVVTAVLATAIVSCGTAHRRARVLSISEILRTPEKFDGRTVTVEASVRDTGAHGMFVVDLQDRRKGLNLSIDPDIAWSEPVMEMTRMLLIDREREQTVGVIANLTGTFSFRRDDLSLFVASKVDKLRWGPGATRAPSHPR